jgi:hypothetical protein
VYSFDGIAAGVDYIYRVTRALQTSRKEIRNPLLIFHHQYAHGFAD